MRFTPNNMKWVLRFYPPFFFQRIWIEKIHNEFMGADIKIFKSILNINANRSIFGGTIFSAVDPIYPILFDGYLKSQGYNTIAWLKSAHIQYLKPGKKQLKFSIRVNQTDMAAILNGIKNEGKVIKTFITEIFDRDEQLCAIAHNEIYVRDLNFKYKAIEKEVLHEKHELL